MIPAYPEIQERAQDELDRVVGRDRLPTVDDEKNLPYCHAIIKEVCLALSSRRIPCFLGLVPVRNVALERRSSLGEEYLERGWF